MAKSREGSDILSIVPSNNGVQASQETAIDTLLKLKQDLLQLVKTIDGDLISLGHKVDEQA